MPPDPMALATIIERCWSLETATTWSPSSPARGQCSVTALLVHEVLGGTIAKTRIGGAWHFYNLIDGKRFDLTARQFNEPISYDDVASDRRDAMSDTTPEQYAAIMRTFRQYG